MKKIRVLIAEDEPPIARRISRLIETCDPAFSVAAVAADGEQAFSIMNQTHCDVLFTDIRMPVMDGIQLMDIVSEQYPQCIMVVVSSFQDFGYAQHAIKARAIDYILKPVSESDMKMLLTRVKTKFGETIQEQLLTQLTLDPGQAFPKEDKRTEADQSILLNICLLLLGSMPPNDNARMAVSSEDVNRLEIGQTANKINAGQTGFIWEFMGNTSVERILISVPGMDDFPDCMKKLCDSLQQKSALPLSCVCYAEQIHMQDISAVSRTLRQQLKNTVHLGKSLFDVTSPKTEAAKIEKDPKDSALAQDLFYSLLQKSPDSEHFFSALFKTIREQDWTQARIQQLFHTTALLFQINPDPVIASQAYDQARLFEEAICNSPDLESLEKAVRLMEPGKKHKISEFVQSIESYLQEHYSEPITTQSLSAVFGYVPSYISSMFKQEYALSPSEYLTKIRIEEAKRLMKDKPEMFCKEIAESVGFKNQHHFSRIFKKTEGIWPTEYQNLWRKR